MGRIASGSARFNTRRASVYCSVAHQFQGIKWLNCLVSGKFRGPPLYAACKRNETVSSTTRARANASRLRVHLHGAPRTH